MSRNPTALQANLLDVDFSGATVNKTSFNNTQMGHVNFFNATVQNTDFHNITQTDYDNNRSNLNFDNANFTNVTFTGGSYDDLNLIRTNLKNVKFASIPPFSKIKKAFNEYDKEHKVGIPQGPEVNITSQYAAEGPKIKWLSLGYGSQVANSDLSQADVEYYSVGNQIEQHPPMDVLAGLNFTDLQINQIVEDNYTTWYRSTNSDLAPKGGRAEVENDIKQRRNQLMAPPQVPLSNEVNNNEPHGGLDDSDNDSKHIRYGKRKLTESELKKLGFLRGNHWSTENKEIKDDHQLQLDQSVVDAIEKERKETGGFPTKHQQQFKLKKAENKAMLGQLNSQNQPNQSQNDNNLDEIKEDINHDLDKEDNVDPVYIYNNKNNDIIIMETYGIDLADQLQIQENINTYQNTTAASQPESNEIKSQTQHATNMLADTIQQQQNYDNYMNNTANPSSNNVESENQQNQNNNELDNEQKRRNSINFPGL